ncbi:MAG: methyl-accepting chemotaxis protein [Pseudomonadota bacterium]|mgnify:CR=1 FL=1|jgi:methyl-accepting chemotaxis protein
MSSSKSWGIAAKIMVAPAVIALLLVFFGLFSSRNTSELERLVQAFNAASSDGKMAQEAEAGVHAMHAAVYRSLALISIKNDAKAEQVVAEQLTLMDEMERTYESDKRPKTQELLALLDAYEAKVRDAYDAATSDPNLGAMMLQGADKAYEDLVVTLQGGSALSRMTEQKTQRELYETLSFMQSSQAIVLLVAVVLGLLIALLAGRRIARPLQNMQTRLSDIARTGDLSMRLKRETGDEVGRTADSVNVLLQSINDGVSEVNRAVTAVAAGDFSQKISADLRGDLAEMKTSVNDAIDRIESTMTGLDKMMGALSSGHFSMRLEVSAQGAYAHTVKQAQQTMLALDGMLGDVGRTLAAVAQGNLAVRVTAQGQGDLNELKNNLNQSLKSLGDAMQAIRSNARQVSVAASESSHAVGQIADGVQNQTHAISQVAVAVRQTAASVLDVSRNTEQASQKSRHSVVVMRDGLMKIEKMVEVVNNIAVNSEKINKITEVIEKIANKTNLLSLNAAIEAARAGEHGKGFAVVADEVGKLAVNSAESSKEIAQLVQQAVLETARAVAAVDAVSADMNLIEIGSQETDEMLRRISAALEQQSRAVDEINANLTSVDMIARGNASATEEITASVMELSRIAESTRIEVDRFQTV